MPDSKFKMPDARCKIKDTRWQIEDARCQMPDSSQMLVEHMLVFAGSNRNGFRVFATRVRSESRLFTYPSKIYSIIIM